jgi:hypothetical protein
MGMVLLYPAHTLHIAILSFKVYTTTPQLKKGKYIACPEPSLDTIWSEIILPIATSSNCMS